MEEREVVKEVAEEQNTKHRPSKLKILSMIVFFFLIVGVSFFFFHEYKAGHFDDAKSLDEYISSYGIFAPLMLTVFQCLKVLYAIVPGAIGCIAGAGMFGWLGGFICNYIGICTGSMLAFLLAKRYGMRILSFVFSEKQYSKCTKWMAKKHRRYPVFLWIAICFPFAPDDFLCYFSGLTSISFKKFAVIILTAKPWTILAYSLIFGLIRK